MGNRPGWTKAWTLLDENSLARHESGATYRRTDTGVSLEPDSDSKIQAIGASAAAQVLKRLQKEAGDLFRKNPRLTSSASPAASDPGGATLRQILRKEMNASTPAEASPDLDLSNQRWLAAVEQYQNLPYREQPRIAEKMGWCLHHLERHEDVEALLEPLLDQIEAPGMAALAYSVKSMDGLRGFGHPKAAGRRALLDRIHQRALQSPPPIAPMLLEMVWLQAYGEPHHKAIALAVEQHPWWTPGLFKACEWRRSTNISAEHLVELLQEVLAGDHSPSKTARLRWEMALLFFEMGKFDDAMVNLEAVLLATEADSDSSPETKAAIHLGLAVCEVIGQSQFKGTTRWLDVFSQVNFNLPSQLRPVALRLDLWLGLQRGDDTMLNTALAELIDHQERSSPYQAETLFQTDLIEIDIPGPAQVRFDFRPDLKDSFPQIIQRARPDLAAFVSAQGIDLFPEIDTVSAVEISQRAEALLACAAVSERPLILRQAAVAWILCERPDWKKAAQLWTRFLLWASEEWRCESAGPMGLDNPRPNREQLLSYIEGVEEVLASSEVDESKTVEILHALLIDTARDLAEHKLYEPMRRIADRVVKKDRDESVLFWAALAHHELGNLDLASTLYDEILEQNPASYGTLFNRLLILKQKPNSARLAELEALVENERFTDDSRQKLRPLVRAAHEASAKPPQKKDPKTILKQAAGQWPSAATSTPNFNALTLIHWLMLQSLISASVTDPATGYLSPSNKSQRPLAPTIELNPTLFDLMRAGLISIDVDASPPSSVSLTADNRFSYVMWDLAWQLSPQALSWSRRVEADLQAGIWPKGWTAELPGIATRIARGEVIQYIRGLADERSWPWPEDQDKLESLARNLVDHVSVSEAYYFCYLGARTAADYRAKYRAPLPSTSTRMVNSTIQKLEHWQQVRYPPKAYDRTDSAPRSWMSRTLYQVVLNWDERAFTTRIADLPFPVEEPAPGKRKPRSKKLH